MTTRRLLEDGVSRTLLRRAEQDRITVGDRPARALDAENRLGRGAVKRMDVIRSWWQKGRQERQRQQNRYKSCTRKVRHVAIEGAEAHAASLNARLAQPRRPYQCPYCSGYHVGRPPTRLIQSGDVL